MGNVLIAIASTATRLRRARSTSKRPLSLPILLQHRQRRLLALSTWIILQYKHHSALTLSCRPSRTYNTTVQPTDQYHHSHHHPDRIEAHLIKGVMKDTASHFVLITHWIPLCIPRHKLRALFSASRPRMIPFLSCYAEHEKHRAWTSVTNTRLVQFSALYT